MIEYKLAIGNKKVISDEIHLHLHPDIALVNRKLGAYASQLNDQKLSKEQKIEMIAHNKDISQAAGSIGIGDFIRYWYIAGDDELNECVDAMRKSFLKFESTSIAERIKCLNSIGNELRNNSGFWRQLAQWECHNAVTFDIEQKIVEEEFDMDSIKIKADMIERSATKNKGTFASEYILKKRPIGTVLVTLAPNAGYSMLNNVFIDLFLAGIPMIIKAPRKSAVVPYELANLYLKKIEEFGLPKSICMITGDSKEIIEKLIANENIKGLIFIGGDNTGNKILQRYSSLKKPIVLEMNGSNIVAYLDDVSKEDFINDINFSIRDRIFGASGQFCLSPKRLLMPDRFIEAALEAANKICDESKPGLMSAESTNLVPVSDIEAVIKQLKDYSNEPNVEVIRLGKRVDINGNEDKEGEFLTPSIILVKDPLNSSIFMREEILGPVIQIGICADLNKAIEIVNKSRYNIRASFHTKDNSSIRLIMAKCRSGGIFFNLRHLRGWGGIAVGGTGDSCESDVGPRFFYDNFLDKHYSFYAKKTGKNG